MHIFGGNGRGGRHSAEVHEDYAREPRRMAAFMDKGSVEWEAPPFEGDERGLPRQDAGDGLHGEDEGPGGSAGHGRTARGRQGVHSENNEEIWLQDYIV